MEWCDAYEKIGKPFAIQTRADLCYKHPEIFKRMKEVGLKWVRMGLESGNQRVLNYMRKGTTVEQNYGAVEVCHKLGLQVIVNYMLGLPTETKEEVLDTLRMINVTRPEQRSAAFYTPIPGTDMWEDCKRRGLLVSDDPTILGTRSITDQPRLKGVDYGWIQTQMYGRLYRQRHGARKILNRQEMEPVRRVLNRVLPRIVH
jgi:coproporphyrinogen III oxidase-like Fe-S oxidoreductase